MVYCIIIQFIYKSEDAEALGGATLGLSKQMSFEGSGGIIVNCQVLNSQCDDYGPQFSAETQ